MKKVFITLLALGTLFTSCNKDDEQEMHSASTDVTFKAGDISPVSGARTSIDGIDSVVVDISALSLSVNDQTVTFEQLEGPCMVDLLTFQSTDTLIWTEETLPVGEFQYAELEMDKSGNSYVVESASPDHIDLQITKPRLEFRLEEGAAIAADTKYVIRLDMNGSLRLNSTGNGKYNLQPQSSSENPYGLIVLEQVQ
ncbi:DUF4382 domain-containing protein [Flammeovirga sp. SubArs3]|uniref:DUF4382 domain-containing protein n=1 Tax=Flammeovirga sp. SubArs3 TaxID=2995316 RepID=UPI00248B127F|nr:DUF4382 domain-containing protein [Flammeovirga sp. SubArs3]